MQCLQRGFSIDLLSVVFSCVDLRVGVGIATFFSFKWHRNVGPVSAEAFESKMIFTSQDNEHKHIRRYFPYPLARRMSH